MALSSLPGPRRADLTTTDPGLTDWRGARITVGALVVYTDSTRSGVGIVEAVVEGFTGDDDVALWIVRRATSVRNSRHSVTVAPVRLTVVDTLPVAALPAETGRPRVREETA